MALDSSEQVIVLTRVRPSAISQQRLNKLKPMELTYSARFELVFYSSNDKSKVCLRSAVIALANGPAVTNRAQTRKGRGSIPCRCKLYTYAQKIVLFLNLCSFLLKQYCAVTEVLLSV